MLFSRATRGKDLCEQWWLAGPGCAGWGKPFGAIPGEGWALAWVLALSAPPWLAHLKRETGHQQLLIHSQEGADLNRGLSLPVGSEQEPKSGLQY